MGAPLDFEASMDLQWQMDRRARKNAFQHHKKRIIVSVVLALVIYIPLFGFILHEPDDGDGYQPTHEPTYESDLAAVELNDFITGDPEATYFLSILGTILVLTMWGFTTSIGTVAYATLQRRTGRLDFLYPAPLPSHSLFWYQTRNILRIAIALPIIIITLLGSLYGLLEHTPGLLLKLVFVFTCTTVNLAAMDTFMRFTLANMADKEAKSFRLGLKGLVWAMTGIILARAFIDSRTGHQSFRDSLSASLLHPLSQILLAYPAAMSHVLSDYGPLSARVAEGLLLMAIPVLLVIYLRLREHRLYEITVEPGSLASMAYAGPIWMPMRPAFEHREVRSRSRFQFLHRAWPSLPNRGHGIRAYLSLRATLALRGPVMLVIAGYWVFVVCLYALFRLTIPEDFQGASALAGFGFFTFLCSSLGLIFLFIAAPTRSVTPTQSGLERTLPLPSWHRYAAQLAAGLSPYALFCGPIAGLGLVAFNEGTDFLRGDLAELFWPLLFSFLVILWMGMSPTATFWLISPDYIPETPQFKAVIAPLAVIAMIIVHIWWLAERGLGPTIFLSATMLSLLVLGGYYRFENSDVGV